MPSYPFRMEGLCIGKYSGEDHPTLINTKTPTDLSICTQSEMFIHSKSPTDE